MHYLHIVHNVYWVSPPCVSEYSMKNVFWPIMNQFGPHFFSVVNFTMLSPAIVLVSGERRVKGLVTCSLLTVPIVCGANCSYKEIWPDHLTTKLVSYQIPVPHLRSDCLLIYIYSLMTWPARVMATGHLTSLRLIKMSAAGYWSPGSDWSTQFVSYCINITGAVQPHGRSLSTNRYMKWFWRLLFIYKTFYKWFLTFTKK